MLSGLASGRLSTTLGCSGESTNPDQKSTEVSMDLARSHQSIRTWVLPWQSNLREQWTSQPQLPARGSHQPGPPIGCVGMPRAHGGPAQGLLEEAEGVFDREAPQVPAPQDAQVGRQWTAPER